MNPDNILSVADSVATGTLVARAWQTAAAISVAESIASGTAATARSAAAYAAKAEADGKREPVSYVHHSTGVRYTEGDVVTGKYGIQEFEGPATLVRMSDLRPGDVIISSYFGIMTVTSAITYGTVAPGSTEVHGARPHQQFRDPGNGLVPLVHRPL